MEEKYKNMNFAIIKHKSVSTLVLLAFFVVGIYIDSLAQNEKVIDKITEAIKQADETKLAIYFNSTIDMEIPGTDGTYSKTQSIVILHDFFAKFKVTSFVINHEGSSNDGSKYMIGTYKTKDTELRLYILLKMKEEKLLIHQLQFEED